MARGFGSGFASGVTAGSQAAARAYQARIDAENQAHLQEQRAEDKETKAQLAAAAAPGEISEQQGLMVRGEDGKAFYIPGDATSLAAKNYASQGYTLGEEPVRYSELTAGGKTISQVDTQNFVGPEPTRGLKEGYDAQRMQRLKDVGIARGRPELAAAYGQLGAQEQQARLTQAQIARLPQQERMDALQLQRAEADEANRILLGHVHRAVATGDFTGAVALMDKTHPDPNGYVRELVKDPDNKEGYIFRTLDPKNNNKVMHTEKLADFDDVIGKAHSLADPTKALPWIQEKRKDTQMRMQFEIMNKKLDAELTKLRGASGVSAYSIGQMKDFDTKRAAIVDQLEKDIAANPEKRQDLTRDATTKITMLATKYGAPGGGLAQLLKPDKAPGRDYTAQEQSTWQDVVKKIQESPGYLKLKTPAEQRAFLLSSKVPEDLLPPDLHAPIALGPNAPDPNKRTPPTDAYASGGVVPRPPEVPPARAELRAAKADLDAATKELKTFGGVRRAGLQEGDTSFAAAQQRATAARARVAAAQRALEQSLTPEQTAPYRGR